MKTDTTDDARGSLRPIQTRYSGHKFRSRLEARWAVFFDAMGYRWEYEPQGYDLGKYGMYLPDFWLPDYQIFAEVKPEDVTAEDFTKIIVLAQQSHTAGVILNGLPRHDVFPGVVWSRYAPSELMWGSFTICKYNLYPCTLPFIFHDFEIHTIASDVKSGIYKSAMMESAIIAAKSARFEHGENGGHQ